MRNIDERVINTIRILSADAVEKAKSGHPGLPMGVAPMAWVLWKEYLKGSATYPNWADRDRFVLSAGHGSMLLYSLLHLFGYGLTMDDIKNFRQLGSLTPGHPEFGVTAGVEVTTGPLGQGIANAVGMAMAERRLAEEFNTPDMKVVNHFTYVIAGDGCMMEGVQSEAASLAGHLKLGKLIVLYDDNGITIDGETTLAFTEDVGKRYEAYGWEVTKVDDGNDLDGIRKALDRAMVDEGKPSLIMVKNIIGYGSPTKAGKSIAHGAPLGEEELVGAKIELGFPPDCFFTIPEDVKEHMADVINEREKDRFQWENLMTAYFEKHPNLKTRWDQWHEYEISPDTLKAEELWSGVMKDDATRNHSGNILNTIFEFVPNLFGGSADLNESTKTHIKGSEYFSYEKPSGSNVAFGVREHGMAAIMNGISLHGGLRPFGSTFLTFADYMKPSIRLSALMKLPVIYIFTHDSIGLGEDGPTHQPIEQLVLLRSIPGLTVFRPADGKETLIAWLEALNKMDGPSAIILSRQVLNTLEGSNKDAGKGGYIVHKESKFEPDVIMIASGSEVGLCVESAKELSLRGIDSRVVSMMSMEIFENQSPEYRNSVLPEGFEKILAVEAAHPMSWYKYTGKNGLVMGIETFGESAPASDLFVRFGFTVENICGKVQSLIK